MINNTYFLITFGSICLRVRFPFKSYYPDFGQAYHLFHWVEEEYDATSEVHQALERAYLEDVEYKAYFANRGILYRNDEYTDLLKDISNALKEYSYGGYGQLNWPLFEKDPFSSMSVILQTFGRQFHSIP